MTAGNNRFKAFWDFVSLSGGEIIGKIAGFVAFAYLARVLEPAGFGSVEFALSLLVLFSLIVDFGYGPVGARDISSYPERTGRYAAIIPTARLFLAILSLLLMCSLALLLDHDETTQQLILVFSIALLATPFNQRWLLQGMDRMQLVSLGQVTRMIAFAAGVILFVHSADDLLRISFVEIGASLLMAAYFLYIQRRLGVAVRLTTDIRSVVSLSYQALPIGLSQIVWAFNQYLPTILVASMTSTVQVAWFGAAHRIIMSAVSFSLLYHFNLFPMLSKRLKQSHADYMALVLPSFRVTGWAGIGIALVVTLFAEPLCMLVYGDKFSVAALPLSILIWILPVTLLSGHARWTLIAGHHQRYALYAQLAGTCAMLAIALWLVPGHGAAGAALAMLACALTVWFSQYLFVMRLVGRMPFLGTVMKPMFLAAAGIVFVRWYADDNLVMLIALPLVYAVLAGVLDRRLFSDVRRLMEIKHEE